MLTDGASGPRGARRFPTTRWSLIRTAGARDPQARQALEDLCRQYWYPLYAFVRRTASTDQAQDLVQGFFASFLERDSLATISKDGGRFRSYLLASLKHFQANESARARTQKRGGGLEPVPIHDAFAEGEQRYRNEPATRHTPEHFFEVRWIYTLLSTTLDRLKADYSEKGQLAEYRVLKEFLPLGDAPRYSEAARALGTNVNNVKQMIHRLRLRFKETVRAEIADTVEHGEQVEAELRYLLNVLGR